MKKFEIINNYWIKQLVFNAKSDKSAAIKISAISLINSWESDDKFCINFFSYGKSLLQFFYNNSEKEQFENDLLFFERLLFNQS